MQFHVYSDQHFGNRKSSRPNIGGTRIFYAWGKYKITPRYKSIEINGNNSNFNVHYVNVTNVEFLI